MENTNTPTSVKSDNELIAEFMGSKPYNDGRYGIMWPDPTDDKVGFGLHYDTKWDWIMKVVEKIYHFEDITFTLKNSRAVIKYGKKTFSCHTIVAINSTYRVVVEFIKWYNTTTNENGE
jgi:hypothetical protein